MRLHRHGENAGKAAIPQETRDMSTEFHLTAGATRREARTPWTSTPSGQAGATPRCASWTCRPAAGTPSPPATANGSCCRCPAAARSDRNRRRRFELTGRESVFSGVTDFAYVPRDAQVEIDHRRRRPLRAHRSPLRPRLPARYGAASDVPVELRGTGNCSRQVNNFGAAGIFDVRQAHRRRGAHPRRQLVVLSAAQARRVPPRRGVRAGGDLLLRDRSPRTARKASATSVSPPPGTAAAPMSWPRSAAATPSSSPTAGTARPSPRPATPCTTSTSWRVPARRASG